MTEQTAFMEAIRRINQMEQIFDRLQTASQADPSAIFNDPALYASLQELMRYYDGGQWLRDYELDERGNLPADLKRGVLSQDAVFDFLTDIKNHPPKVHPQRNMIHNKRSKNMIQENIHYFETAGREHTEETLKLAVETARALGIRDIVLATTEGGTAKMMADSIDHEGITVTVVTHAFGQATPNTNPLSAELRRHLVEKGFRVCTAAHALSGAERCLSKTFTGVYPVEIIAHTLRMFGQGTKVCVEICAMAADAGLIMTGEPVVAVGGTGRGADTAIVLRPEVSSRVLKTKIDRIICKPIE